MIKNPYLFEKRAIKVSDEETNFKPKQTSVSMERIYWAVIDNLAKRQKRGWRHLVWEILINRPKTYQSRAGWLRAYVAGYAYVFMTRPDAKHNPPQKPMKWAYRAKYFTLPKPDGSK